MYARQQKILDMLQKNRRIDLVTAAEELGVSAMTLRRDLRSLEARKLLLQVRKGAIPYPANYAPENLPEDPAGVKCRLAQALYRRIFPCSTLFIGTGSTCLAFAQTVAHSSMQPETVITHSLAVGAAFFRSRCRVILLGGELRTGSMDLVGAMTEQNLEEYQVDYLISGCDGASADYGFYTSDERLSNLEKKTISIAEKTVILTESGKFRRRSFTRFAPVSAVNIIVTDDALPETDAAKLRRAGAELITVPESAAESAVQ